MIRNGLNQYKLVNEITSTRKTKQVVMLYDGMIKFLNEALIAIENSNIEIRYNKTHRISQIIDGLHKCLDAEKGGEIAEVLDKFYSNMYVRVINLNFEQDATKNYMDCSKIIADIRMMRDAWQEIDSRYVSQTLEVNNKSVQKDCSKDKSNPGSIEISV